MSWLCWTKNGFANSALGHRWTLMRSERTGAYKDYTIPVLEEIFGTSGQLETMRVSGMTTCRSSSKRCRSGVPQEQIVGDNRSSELRMTEEARARRPATACRFSVASGRTRRLRSADEHPRYARHC
jgi:hypothetical protein